MYKVTNQQLYSDIRQAMNDVELNEYSAEAMYSAIQDTLQDQEGFTEELIEKCASIAFDAVNDLYSQSQGIEVQSIYSGENLEDLFAAENQELYATWVGRAANYVGSAAMGLKDGFQYFWRRKKYRRDKQLGDSIGEKAAKQHGKGFWGRVAAGTQAQYRRNRLAAIKRDRAGEKEFQKKLAEKNSEKVQSKKSFFERFNDHKGAFMGLGKGGGGFTNWAKNNKAQAATAGAVGAAAIGGAGYLAYRAYKKRKAAQANQQQNATHQVQPNVQ